MKWRGTSGVIDPVTLSVLCALGLGYVLGGWKPLAMFKQKPPTAQLTELQSKLEQQTKAAEQAKIAAEQAKIAERAKLESQVRSAQLDNAGTVAALTKAPQSPEVILGLRMANRVGFKLGTAIGKLPEAEQQEIISMIEELLSNQQAEIAKGEAKLAALDSRFQAVTAERTQLQAQIPILAQKAQKAEEQAAITSQKVTEKTAEVKKWADKTYMAEQASGTLMASVERLGMILVIAYVVIVFILPGITKHLDPTNPFKGYLRSFAGYLSSPLLFHDAKSKLTKLTNPNP